MEIVVTGKFGLSVAIICVLCNCEYVYSSAAIMKDIAKGFTKALEECKKELNLEDSILSELYYFWKEDYDKVSRNVGCTILCMSQKLELITDGKMHHDNAEEFAKKHGADQQMAKKLVEIIHGCEKANSAIEDECARVVEVAKCFRTEIDKLSWTPNMQEVLGEIMTEA